jgi:hypothetical protein
LLGNQYRRICLPAGLLFRTTPSTALLESSFLQESFAGTSTFAGTNAILSESAT